MALVKCSECGKDVSDTASACPSCGAPLKQVPVVKPGGCRRLVTLTLIASAVIVVLIIVMNLSGHDLATTPVVTPQQAAAAQRRDAAYACEAMSKKQLNDPGSADFPDLSEVDVSDNGANRWNVQFVGRAKNGFGALMAHKFKCTIEYRPSSKEWAAVSLSQ